MPSICSGIGKLVSLYVQYKTGEVPCFPVKFEWACTLNICFDPLNKYYDKALRNHWGIENSLHWQLDVNFDEDDNRVTKRHAAENLALIRRLTRSLLYAHPANLSVAKKQFAAALDPDFLGEILQADGILEKR